MSSWKEKAMHVIGNDTSAGNFCMEGGRRQRYLDRRCFHSLEKETEEVLRDRERAREGGYELKWVRKMPRKDFMKQFKNRRKNLWGNLPTLL